MPKQRQSATQLHSLTETLAGDEKDSGDFLRLLFWFFSILIAIGNNMFDGLIESRGAALIDQSMNLPIKYYGFY